MDSQADINNRDLVVFRRGTNNRYKGRKEPGGERSPLQEEQSEGKKKKSLERKAYWGQATEQNRVIHAQTEI